jgi:hypothetical protein
MGRFSNGLELVKLSFKVIGKNKQLLVFPFLSGFTAMIILATFLVGFIFALPTMQSMPSWAWFVIGFSLYIILFFITIFFNAALVACAMATIEGGTPTIGYGISMASKKIGKIFAWAVISAIVGMILQAVRERAGILGRIAVGILGAAWTVATYFVIPIIVFEDIGAWASVKRSFQLLRSSWGEALVGYISMGLIFFLLAIGGLIPIIMVVVLTRSVWALVIGIVAYVIYLVFLAALHATASGVIQAALYRYATTGKLDIQLPSWFPPPPAAYMPPPLVQM